MRNSTCRRLDIGAWEHPDSPCTRGTTVPIRGVREATEHGNSSLEMR